MNNDMLSGPVIITVALFALGAIGFVCDHLTKVRKAELEATLHQEEMQLKRDMIHKGMSANEIAQVLGAGTGAKKESLLNRLLGD